MGRKKKQVTEEVDPSSKGLLSTSEAGGSMSSIDVHDGILVDQEFTEEVLRLHVETGIVREYISLTLVFITFFSFVSDPTVASFWCRASI